MSDADCDQPLDEVFTSLPAMHAAVANSIKFRAHAHIQLDDRATSPEVDRPFGRFDAATVGGSSGGIGKRKAPARR